MALLCIPLDNKFLYLAIGCFALSLPAVFEYTKDNRVMNFLGDLTYPLYLTHALVISAITSTWSGLGTWGGKFISAAKSVALGPYIQSLLFTAMLTSLVIAVAIFTHFIVEQPSAFIFRRVLDFKEHKGTPRTLLK
jgi:peptidoglycan/LPS O-acetylase OafA/YrhL